MQVFHRLAFLHTRQKPVEHGQFSIKIQVHVCSGGPESWGHYALEGLLLEGLLYTMLEGAAVEESV